MGGGDGEKAVVSIHCIREYRKRKTLGEIFLINSEIII